MKHDQVQKLILSALGMALVFLATYLIKIPNGIQGYFNLGDGFLMLFASILNPFLAFLVGGVGSGLADIAGGYGIYFIPTLLIKGLEALVIAFAWTHIRNNVKYVSYAIGAILMISGYFLCDSLINESWALGLTGIPANLLQAGIGISIACIALPLIKKHRKELS